MRSKHPSRAALDSQSPTPNSDSSIALHESDILSAIKAFLPGSAGGPDGLRPQHLKDLTSESAGDAGHRLVTRLTEFTNMCLKGHVPVDIQPVFCGASLCALAKKDGGIRPIAVSSTLRHLVSKAACKKVSKKMATEFSPIQLGFGIPRASESVAHATRSYVANLQSDQGLLKLDFCNAFNMVHRDNLFQTVHDVLPELYPFVHMCYALSSLLNFGDYLLLSDEGVQQGGPLGLLLFCASSLKLARSMTSEFNLWYMDDSSVGGDVSSLLYDLDTIQRVGPTIGLVLNDAKCEIITNDDNMVASFQAAMPNICHIQSDDVIMLGAPVGSESSVDMVLNDKLAAFWLLASRLTSLQAQDALFLLKNCFSTPKLLYMLRCGACYKSAVLSEYDGVIRDTLKIVLNVDLPDDIWKQATLPVSKAGLGVRFASDLALPAFLSSVNSVSELTLQLLPARLHAVSSIRDPAHIVANLEWQQRSTVVVPDGSRIGVQKAWDTPLVSRKLAEVISAAQTQVGHARLIAAAAPHSGDFLTRFLVLESVRDLMIPPFVSPFHCVSVPPCVHCTRASAAPKSTASVFTALPVANPPVVICDITPSMILSNLPWRQQTSLPCWSRNRYQEMMENVLTASLCCHNNNNNNAQLVTRHMSVNAYSYIYERTESQARTGGLSVTVGLPWANGRCLVWDFTCPDTLAASNLNRVVISPGAVANDAEDRKTAKYLTLAPLCNFKPITVETLRALGDCATDFSKTSVIEFPWLLGAAVIPVPVPKTRRCHPEG